MFRACRRGARRHPEWVTYFVCSRAILKRMAGEDKPKIFENGRDMMLSLGVIVVGMVAVVGATGLCTINPETSDLSAVREVDGAEFLGLEARTPHGAGIRVPDVPQDWVANSARRAAIAQEPA